MHTDRLSDWTHEHVFERGSTAAERGTRQVMAITAAMMVIEIVAGWWFNSMALLADGWHMSSHAVAIGLSAVAYAAARRFARDQRFAFGTWKIEVLAGYSSALFLLGVVAMMIYGSVARILAPTPIQYVEALVVAALGLVVNVVCALILSGAQEHGPETRADHGHGHRHDHHHDLNLKSAYVHVIADAATSVLAIIALLGGWIWGWSWLDPVMGIVGAALVAVWAKGLLAETGKVLLDREMDHPVVAEVREVIDGLQSLGETRLVDLHVWRVGKRSYSCAVAVVSHDPAVTVDVIRERLLVHEEIVHSTIEIQRCPEDGRHTGRTPE